MKSLIKLLYDGEYRGEEVGTFQEYQENMSRREPYEDQIEQLLGRDFLEEYCDLNAEREGLVAERGYRAGVSFAVRFLAEALL